MMTKSRKVIIERTMANLDCINAIKTLQATAGKVTAPYDVTQLVNSFLMTLLHNWDELKNGWPQLKQNGVMWPKIQSSKPNQPAQQCVGKIRNALAHGCFVFEGPEDGEIAALHLWICRPPDYKEVEWHAEISVSDMRQMLDCFVQLAEANDLPPRAAKRKGQSCQ